LITRVGADAELPGAGAAAVQPVELAWRVRVGVDREQAAAGTSGPVLTDQRIR
jgi:hypothetical protein